MWKIVKEYRCSKRFAKGAKLIRLAAPCFVDQIGIEISNVVVDFVIDDVLHRGKETRLLAVTSSGKFLGDLWITSKQIGYWGARKSLFVSCSDYESSCIKQATVFLEHNERLAIERLLGIERPDRRCFWTIADWMGA